MTDREVAEQLQIFLENTSALDIFQYSFYPSHGMETVHGDNTSADSKNTGKDTTNGDDDGVDR